MLALALGVALSLVDFVLVVGLVHGPDAATATALLLAHLGVGALAAALLQLRAPLVVRRDRLRFALAAGLLSICVPVVGPLGLSAFLTFGLGKRGFRADVPFVLEEFPRTPLKRPVGVGRMPSAIKIASILGNHAPETAERRFRNVLLTRALPPKVSLDLLKTALRDPSDEVRLFAFSRIEHVRDEIETSIRELEFRLDAAEPYQRGRLHLRLAESHLQICEYGLADGAVYDLALDKARAHAANASELVPDSSAAWFVHGRILLLQKRFAEADPVLGEAMRLGYSAETVVPLQAECAFRLRDFERVAFLLRELGVDRATLPVGALSTAPPARPTRPSLMRISVPPPPSRGANA